MTILSMPKIQSQKRFRVILGSDIDFSMFFLFMFRPVSVDMLFVIFSRSSPASVLKRSTGPFLLRFYFSLCKTLTQGLPFPFNACLLFSLTKKTGLSRARTCWQGSADTVLQFYSRAPACLLHFELRSECKPLVSRLPCYALGFLFS